MHRHRHICMPGIVPRRGIKSRLEKRAALMSWSARGPSRNSGKNTSFCRPWLISRGSREVHYLRPPLNCSKTLCPTFIVVGRVPGSRAREEFVNPRSGLTRINSSLFGRLPGRARGDSSLPRTGRGRNVGGRSCEKMRPRGRGKEGERKGRRKPRSGRRGRFARHRGASSFRGSLCT